MVKAGGTVDATTEAKFRIGLSVDSAFCFGSMFAFCSPSFVHCLPYEGVEPMGRGRAKAKQTKVARELKYSSPETDLDALQRELSHPSSDSHRSTDDTNDTVDSDEAWEPRRR